MSIQDNGGFIIGNAGDAKYPQDLVNLRTLERKTKVIEFTPSASTDSRGVVGQITIDDNYIYWKTSTQWLRSSGSTF